MINPSIGDGWLWGLPHLMDSWSNQFVKIRVVLANHQKIQKEWSWATRVLSSSLPQQRRRKTENKNSCYTRSQIKPLDQFDVIETMTNLTPIYSPSQNTQKQINELQLPPIFFWTASIFSTKKTKSNLFPPKITGSAQKNTCLVRRFNIFGPSRLVQVVRGPGGDLLHEELLRRTAAQSHRDFVQDGLLLAAQKATNLFGQVVGLEQNWWKMAKQTAATSVWSLFWGMHFLNKA